jgi:hypothetical protein
MRRIAVFQLIPGTEVSELDTAIFTREFAAKGQEEVFERVSDVNQVDGLRQSG